MTKIICIIQARMASTRFPGKIMSPILGYPQLYRVINRVMQSKIKNIVVATTTNTEDNIIQCMLNCYNINMPVIRGSENDVLSRYILAADTYNADAVIRITADCPLIDPNLINEIVDTYTDNNDVQYITFDNTLYLEGVASIELLKTSTLKYIAQKTVEYSHREHVTTYIKDNLNNFKTIIKKPSHVSFILDNHLSVDTIDDLNKVRKVYHHFHPRTDFAHNEIIEYLYKHTK